VTSVVHPFFFMSYFLRPLLFSLRLCGKLCQAVVKGGCSLRLFLCPQIRVTQQRVIHAVGKVRRADRQSQLNNLLF
jgi:hypothetical protein